MPGTDEVIDEEDRRLIDQYFERYRVELEVHGDRTALIRALGVSSMNSIPLPPWAEGYVKNACKQYDEGLVASFDEALDLPRRRKPRSDTIRRKRLAKTICPRIQEILDAEHCSIECAAMTLEDELICNGIEISHEAIAKIYYDFRNDHARIPEAKRQIASLND